MAIEQEAHQQDPEGGGEGQHGQGREGRPGKVPEKPGMQEPGGDGFSGAANDGDKNRLEEQQRQPGQNGRENQSSFAKYGEGNKVQRQQKGNGFEGDPAGSGGSDAARRKKFQGAVAQKQSSKREQDAAGVEAPGQQHAGAKYSIKGKHHGSGWNSAEGAAKDHTGRQQEDASRQDQRSERFWAPEIHAPVNSFRLTHWFGTIIRLIAEAGKGN